MNANQKLEKCGDGAEHGMQKSTWDAKWSLVVATRGLPWLMGTLTILLVGVSCWLRVSSLGHIPGVNGDEAWYGNLVQDLFSGQHRFVTPSRVPVNPFFAIPLLLLHCLFDPSVSLLRVPALLSGFAALIVNYALARKFYSRKAAVWSTTILAILPIMIAYSRFGWDTAQMPLATVVIIYAALATQRNPTERNLRLAWIALFAGLIVHPTCLFLTPLTLFLTMDAMGRDLPEIVRRGFEWSRTPRTMFLLAGMAALITTIRFDWQFGRLIPTESFSTLIQFLALLGDLLSGRTAMTYLSGASTSDVSWTVWRLLTLSITFVSVAKMLRSDVVEIRLVGCGFTLWLTAFFVAVGTKGLAPGFERYGMFLIVPVVFIWTHCLVELSLKYRRSIAVVLLIVGSVNLFQFHLGYFAFIRDTGGSAAMTFRTADQEPKACAARFIETCDPKVAKLVLTSSFHCYQPLKYLLRNAMQTRVVLVQSNSDIHDAIKQSPTSQLWFVDFSANEQRDSMDLLKIAGASTVQCIDFPDTHRPVVKVLRSCSPRSIFKADSAKISGKSLKTGEPAIPSFDIAVTFEQH